MPAKPAATRTIVIEIFEDNDFTITENALSCDRLCWEEMLGSIAELTHPKIGKTRFQMLTAEQHNIQEARHARLMELNEAHPGWRDFKYENGAPKFDRDGMMLAPDGTRSIFDDIDQQEGKDNG